MIPVNLPLALLLEDSTDVMTPVVLLIYLIEENVCQREILPSNI